MAKGASKWTMFTLENLTPRAFVMMSVLNEDQILIAGGYGKKDAVTFRTDAEDREGQVVCQGDFGGFRCFGRSVMVESGHVVAVCGYGGDRFVVYYNQQENTLQKLHELPRN